MIIHKIKEKILQYKLVRRLWFKRKMRQDETKNKVIGKNNKLINFITVYNVKYNIAGDNNIIELAENTKLSNLDIVIFGNNNKIVIGNATDIRGGLLWVEGNNCTLEIGNDVLIVDFKCSVAEDNQQVIIKDKCLFSYGVDIKTSDSHSILDLKTGKRINSAKSIEIDEHVWIGSNATILKGVKLGKNAIIGTGSVVTTDVASNTVVGGNPAKILKEGVTWDMDRIDNINT